MISSHSPRSFDENDLGVNILFSETQAGSGSNPTVTADPTPVSPTNVIGDLDIELAFDDEEEEEGDEEIDITPQRIPSPTASAWNWRKIARTSLYGLTAIGSYVLLSTAGAVEATDNAKGVYEGTQQTHKDASLLTIGLTSALCFAFEVGLNFQGPLANLKQTIKALTTRKLPHNFDDADEETKEEWSSTLSESKSTAALVFAAPLIPLLVFNSSCNALFFTKSLPQDYPFLETDEQRALWETAVIALTCGVGVSKLLTESIEIIKTLRYLLLNKPTSYANKFSRWTTPVLTTILAALSALETSTTDYITGKSNFNIENRSFLMFFYGTISFLTLIPNFIFSSVGISQALDDFFDYVANKTETIKIGSIPVFLKFNEPLKVTAFLLTLGAVAYTMYYRRYLDTFFLRDTVTEIDNAFDLHIDPKKHDDIYRIFTDGMYGKNLITWTAALSYVAYKMSNSAYTRATGAFTYIRNLCNSNEEVQPLLSEKFKSINETPNDVTDLEAQKTWEPSKPIEVYRTGNRNTFYHSFGARPDAHSVGARPPKPVKELTSLVIKSL